MSEDIESRIDRIEETVEDNNRILKKIRRKEVFNFWFNIIKILIFIGAFYYGYKFLEPVIQQFMAVYSSLKETADTANEIRSNINIGVPGVDLQEFFQKITSQSTQ